MRQSSPSWIFWSTLLSCPAAAFHTPLLPRQFEPETFDWSAITPTPELQYHPCYNDTFQCARLQVPLDWSRPETAQSGPHVALGIITLPATVPVTDPAYGGPLLINPGGPAGPVAEWVRVYGRWLQGVVDTPGERHHDIVGVDPRGLWRTTPTALCYTDQFSRATAGMLAKRLPSVLTPQGLQMAATSHQGVARLCEQTAAGDGPDSIFNHMSTASVARDLLEVVERSHEMMVKAGNGTGKARGGGEKPKMQYLGLSYGSILGSTFASMFPDRVGRMVVDGIADAEDFNSGQRVRNINDAENAIDILYRTCFDAGELCPLYQTTDASAADIRARIDALILSLEKAPVSAIHNGRVFLVSSLFIREELRQGLYTPIPMFDSLAHSLAGALAGNFSLILSNPRVLSNDNPAAVCNEFPNPSPGPPTTFTNQPDANLGIACGDSQAAAGARDTLAWAADTIARVANQSPSIGEAWANLPLVCAGWRFNPPYAFRGPFGSPAPPPGGAAGPLLILSSRTDHVTPLRNAYRLSSLHGGSAVVVQESVGHCALTSSVSECTRGLVRAYFRTGQVPRNGTVCEADCVPGIPYRECKGLPP
ncbi:TAP-like protein-domain-containing protein [Chaetomium sp. MPI-CAGE-AT-0009]|nr:TAP-like protein-domain-containing protein [Chaetomium sp. MPI-CAGE-AT-0009]